MVTRKHLPSVYWSLVSLLGRNVSLLVRTQIYWADACLPNLSCNCHVSGRQHRQIITLSIKQLSILTTSNTCCLQLHFIFGIVNVRLCKTKNKTWYKMNHVNIQQHKIHRKKHIQHWTLHRTIYFSLKTPKNHFFRQKINIWPQKLTFAHKNQLLHTKWTFPTFLHKNWLLQTKIQTLQPNNQIKHETWNFVWIFFNFFAIFFSFLFNF